jgi:hypothetical protein
MSYWHMRSTSWSQSKSHYLPFGKKEEQNESKYTASYDNDNCHTRQLFCHNCAQFVVLFKSGDRNTSINCNLQTQFVKSATALMYCTSPCANTYYKAPLQQHTFSTALNNKHDNLHLHKFAITLFNIRSSVGTSNTLVFLFWLETVALLPTYIPENIRNHLPASKTKRCSNPWYMVVVIRAVLLLKKFHPCIICALNFSLWHPITSNPFI